MNVTNELLVVYFHGRVTAQVSDLTHPRDGMGKIEPGANIGVGQYRGVLHYCAAVHVGTAFHRGATSDHGAGTDSSRRPNERRSKYAGVLLDVGARRNPHSRLDLL